MPLLRYNSSLMPVSPAFSTGCYVTVVMMEKTKLAEYLFKKIKDSGVDCTFGIPGDFILPLYAAQSKTGLKTVVMTHEPSVGYAADAYARLKGLGIAMVTYGAGGLNMI